MQLPEGEFLPFAAAWPAIRDGYLQWLSSHEAKGARFVSGETDQSQRLGAYRLAGRIDRIDAMEDGTVVLLDYKTESLAKTRLRVKNPLEDTQMAFYAALMPQDMLLGSYVNIGEREGTSEVAQNDIVAARDALLEGIAHDMQAIAQGAPMRVLGAGDACTFCQARGLCRKDFQAVA
jgi:ATP-dependent helicase/nuclease subunit B